jgi:hypothetical protein
VAQRTPAEGFDLSRHGRNPIRSSSRRDDISAGRCQSDRQRPPDAAGPTDDDGRVIMQIEEPSHSG